MSNTTTQTASRGGIGFLGLLTIVLLVLKATGYLPNLSWVWVFAPLWIPVAITLAFLIGLGIFILVGTLWEKYRRRNYRRK